MNERHECYTYLLLDPVIKWSCDGCSINKQDAICQINYAVEI